MAQSLMRGTLVLTAASMVTRAIGLAYRVYLVRLAGPEVIGLFQMIFPLYFTLIILASAGLPLATSKMVADRMAAGGRSEVAKVMRVALPLATIMGIVVTLVLFASARPISYNILKDGRTYAALIVIAPALPAIAISSTLKGYFQGMSYMTPVAISQVGEQLIHVAATVGLVVAYKHAGDAVVTAVLAVGSLLGDLGGLAFISICYWLNVRRYRLPASRIHKGPSLLSRLRCSVVSSGKILKEMAYLALPVTAGRITVSLNSAINAALIPNLLRMGGMSPREVTVAFGELSGMAMNLLTIPTVFTASMAMSLVPSVASSTAKRSGDGITLRTWQSLKATLIIGTFFASCFLSMGLPLCRLLFNSERAGILLVMLAPGGVALYAQHVLAGVLQGLNKPIIPMISSLVSTAFSTLCLYILVGRTDLGIGGAAITMTLALSLGYLICLSAVKRYVKLPSLQSLVLRLIIIGLITGVVGWQIYVFLTLKGWGLGASVVGAAVAEFAIYISALGVLKVASFVSAFSKISRK